MTGLLGTLLAAGTEPPAYALLHRPESGAPDRVEVLVGDVAEAQSLADLPLSSSRPGHELLAVVPFRQLAERGFAAPDDGAPLLALRITEQESVDLTDAVRLLPDDRLAVRDAGFAVDDEAYADLVRTVLTEEIGRGRGANFVIERPFTAEIDSFGTRAALSVFRRLLLQERGTYWTFLVRVGDRTFVGASPERHVSAVGGEVVMNPISGTYRYPAGGPSVPGVLSFLADRKETDELLMVVDEELKMMGRICERGGRVVGPYLKPMARLAHTEYLIKGHSTRSVPDILRETLFAPTVTGSPLESACEVISRYEPAGRGYYSGVLALVGRDATGERRLDSTILIRTAHIDTDGRARIGVGATLVRHSDPEAEVAETHTKVAGLLAAIRGGEGGADNASRTAPDGHAAAARRDAPPASDGRIATAQRDAPADPDARIATTRPDAPPAPDRSAASDGRAVPARRDAPRAPGSDAPAAPRADSPVTDWSAHPDVRTALARRNAPLASFWLDRRDEVPAVVRGSVLVVDAEDAFTAMLGQQLAALGLTPRIRRWDEPAAVEEAERHDLVVVGPGPGDPRDLSDPKIAALRMLTRQLLDSGRPFLSVCLGHQVLAGELGLDLVRKPRPHQGRQRVIDLFGHRRRVGFYNSFAALADRDRLTAPVTAEVSRDTATHEVHALRGPHFHSVQFHPESVLSTDGFDVLRESVTALLTVLAPAHSA